MVESPPTVQVVAVGPDDARSTPESAINRVAQRLAAVRPESWLTLVAVAGSALFVFWQLRPDLLFANTTPNGGDTGAHVWGPAFIRDHLLPEFRITGWTPDWYAGFPAFQFYMVVPALGIVALSFLLPYGIAFKLVTVAGVVALPVAAWGLARSARLGFPAPALISVFSLVFLFDDNYWIWGGNVASMLAGEFAYSISLTLALVYLGVVMMGLQTGRHRVLAAMLLALVTLCHLIPAIFAVVATAVLLVFFRGRRQVGWLAVTLPLAGLLAAFWLLPFWWRRNYVNDMGWVKLDNYWANLFRTDLSWLIALATAALIVSVLRSFWFGRAMSAIAVVAALAFRFAPEWRLWNARLLPFYYLCLAILAAYGVACLLRVGLGRTIGSAEVLRPPGRASVAAALTIPIAAALVLFDELVLSGRLLSNLAEAFLGVSAAEGARLQDQLAELCELVLIAGLIVAGVEIAARLEIEVQEGWGRQLPRRLVAVGAAVVGAAVVISVALPLRALGPFGVTSGAEYGLGLGDTLVVGTAERSFVPAWVRWNYTGYERKVPNDNGGGYPEYHDLVTTMAEIGEERGCGRAMWEYDKLRLDSYGTPMSLMLLPHWTDGCIGSMEGLYFESSVTVPYHFINQSELSLEPSRPMRDIPYPGFDVDAGVEHLQLLGVRYYLAVSEAAVADARRNPDLTELASSGPWVVFEVGDSALVEPLSYEPVVVEGIADTPRTWVDAAVVPYIDDPGSAAMIAASGPEDWARAGSVAEVEPIAVEPAVVSDIDVTTSRISFQVDEVGKPVLVKASYFPNWQASGAEGPYRVAPNLMVVIPTDTTVDLTYGWTPVDGVAYALTGVGIVVAALLAWRPRLIPWGLEEDAESSL